MIILVALYVKLCRRPRSDMFTCCRVKMPRHHPYGLLVPLPIPSKLWQSISQDFVTDLPNAKRFNALLTVVDRYTKMVLILPCTKEITSEDTTRIVMRECFGTMVFPTTSSMIMDLNSYLKFGCDTNYNNFETSGLRMGLLNVPIFLKEETLIS